MDEDEFDDFVRRIREEYPGDDLDWLEDILDEDEDNIEEEEED
jgi:hypothetical protein